MTFELLASLVFFIHGAHAAGAPDGAELLRQAAEPPARPYSAEALVVRNGRRQSRQKLRLSARPDGAVRRELDAPGGGLESLVVSDGSVDWLYVPGRKLAWRRPAGDPFAKRFGPDEELDRLAENYALESREGEAVAGRPTWLVSLEPRVPGAGVRRRLWLDRDHGVVLKSETERPDGQLAASMTVEKLDWGRAAAKDFRFAAPEGVKTLAAEQQDYLELDEAGEASGLTPRPPRWLPEGYVLESVDVLRRGGKSVLHYRFTDGLSVLSLFQAPPKTRLGLRGRARRPARVAGARRALSTWTDDGNVLGWSKGNERFILVGALPLEVLTKVGESVP